MRPFFVVSAYVYPVEMYEFILTYFVVSPIHACSVNHGLPAVYQESMIPTLCMQYSHNQYVKAENTKLLQPTKYSTARC
jgi:hypothetical protein